MMQTQKPTDPETNLQVRSDELTMKFQSLQNDSPPLWVGGGQADKHLDCVHSYLREMLTKTRYELTVSTKELKESQKQHNTLKAKTEHLESQLKAAILEKTALRKELTREQYKFTQLQESTVDRQTHLNVSVRYDMQRTQLGHTETTADYLRQAN